MAEDRDMEMTLDVAGFVAELRRLADALESGAAFTIHVEGEDVTIPEGARFSIAHEREDGEIELEFQVTWEEEESDDEEEEEEDKEEGDEHEASEASEEGEAKPDGEADKA